MRSSSLGRNWLVLLGVLFLMYALLGNYVALPGYLRFIERGGVSEAGHTFDLNVLIGAAKTITWMFSFQIGVLCLAVAHARANRLYTRYVAAGGVVWLMIWSWPSLPAPPAAFYVVLGTVLLIAIGFVLTRRTSKGSTAPAHTLLLGAIVFFAFATWEVCGLGTAGRILHPEEAGGAMAHNLVVTQSSKLMVKFVLAWVLLAMSLIVGRRSQP